MVSVPVTAAHHIAGRIGSGDDEGVVTCAAVERIDARAAGDPVIAILAVDDVVAVTAAQIVVGGAAGDPVIAGTAVDIGNPGGGLQAAEVEIVGGGCAKHRCAIAGPNLD